MPGDWHLLGILDALPGAGPDPDNPRGLSKAEQAVTDLAGSDIGSLTARISTAARKMLGRPDHAWGVSPLLIFREASGPGPDGG